MRYTVKIWEKYADKVSYADIVDWAEFNQGWLATRINGVFTQEFYGPDFIFQMAFYDES